MFKILANKFHNATLKKVHYILRKRMKDVRGVAALELVFVLPLFLLLIFVLIELREMYNTKIALDMIVSELTYDYSVYADTGRFAQIINSRSAMNRNVHLNNLSYTIVSFPNIASVVTDSNHGGETPYYDNPGNALKTPSGVIRSSGSRNTTPRKGEAFILTLVCKYAFMIELVRPLFDGGHNTVNESGYIFFARGVGICDTNDQD